MLFSYLFYLSFILFDFTLDMTGDDQHHPLHIQPIPHYIEVHQFEKHHVFQLKICTEKHR